MSIGIIGGILLILGAYLVYRGEIFYSVFVYFIADICWVGISFLNGDYVGAGFIIIGMLLGLLAFSKMHSGRMHKNLKSKLYRYLGFCIVSSLSKSQRGVFKSGQ